MSDFYLVAGLGNPGREYAGTRHNVGFETLDVLMEKAGLNTDKMKTFGRGLVAGGMIDGVRVMFLKPVTYMNRSGDSVREVVEYYRIDPETRLIVICDDIYLNPGAIR
ncbi:MAG: aminoacyl-tRNA hydrolase, partial [Lachnospiraceae bacterium]|nr:aminoacyl-tRNA hydrolase [Lachnospiraceae bacterium]